EAQALRPIVHDERVVDADAIDLVDAERAHLVIGEIEARALIVRAGRGERPRQREHDDAFAAEQLGRRHILPAIGVRPGDALVADAGLEDMIGNWTALHATLLI